MALERKDLLIKGDPHLGMLGAQMVKQIAH